MTEGAAVKGTQTPDGRNTRWQEHRRKRRDKIVSAAVLAINQYGAGVGMNEIAAAAKVSKPVLYRHFSDQAELFRAVGRYAAQLMVDRLSPHIRLENNPAHVVTTVIDVYLEAIETEPELYRFVTRYAFADENPVDATEGYRGVVVNLIESALRLRLAEVDTDITSSQAWAHGLVGMVQNVGEWWLEHPAEANRHQLTTQLSSLIWNGLSHSLSDAISLSASED